MIGADHVLESLGVTLADDFNRIPETFWEGRGTLKVRDNVIKAIRSKAPNQGSLSSDVAMLPTVPLPP